MRRIGREAPSTELYPRRAVGAGRCIRFTAVVAVLTAALLGSSVAAEAAAKRCKPIRNVAALDGSRYEGSDIYRIRARGTSCRRARRVALRGTLKGMRLGATVSDYTWRRWSIHRDLIGPTDSYDAQVLDALTQKHVTWLFGEL
jgi:hypothetical protein